jgi:hypothetical protein
MYTNQMTAAFRARAPCVHSRSMATARDPIPNPCGSDVPLVQFSFSVLPDRTTNAGGENRRKRVLRAPSAAAAICGRFRPTIMAILSGPRSSNDRSEERRRPHAPPASAPSSRPDNEQTERGRAPVAKLSPRRPVKVVRHDGTLDPTPAADSPRLRRSIAPCVPASAPDQRR